MCRQSLSVALRSDWLLLHQPPAPQPFVQPCPWKMMAEVPTTKQRTVQFTIWYIYWPQPAIVSSSSSFLITQYTPLCQYKLCCPNSLILTQATLQLIIQNNPYSYQPTQLIQHERHYDNICSLVISLLRRLPAHIVS